MEKSDALRLRMEAVNKRTANLYGSKLEEAAELAKEYSLCLAQLHWEALVKGAEDVDDDTYTYAKGIMSYANYLGTLWSKPMETEIPKKKRNLFG